MLFHFRHFPRCQWLKVLWADKGGNWSISLAFFGKLGVILKKEKSDFPDCSTDRKKRVHACSRSGVVYCFFSQKLGVRGGGAFISVCFGLESDGAC